MPYRLENELSLMNLWNLFGFLEMECYLKAIITIVFRFRKESLSLEDSIRTYCLTALCLFDLQ